ncbi:hypothetical protein N9L06_05285 [Mariniblastus sp.]|nr:hypothetical protein [Mariniblastus sp.]MDA8563848.1 hypothetical protein [Mariniblastus sp.]
MNEQATTRTRLDVIDDLFATIPIAKVFGTVTAIAAVSIALTNALPLLRYVSALIWLLSLLATIALLLYAIHKNPKPQVWTATGWAGAIFIGIQFLAPTSASAHPLFKTPLSGDSYARPAVLVDVLDESEFWGTAELCLKVQSSRFPSDVAVVFPINRGDFVGCRSRFIQLPFEVSDGDLLLLNVLDDQSLSVDQETVLLNACESAGYCLTVGAYICRPDLGRLIEPGFMGLARVVGDGIAMELQSNPFRNMGSAEYIVQTSRPNRPQDANRVTLLSSSNHGCAQVRLYYPNSPLN